MKKIIFIFIGIFSIISCTNDILEINDANVSPTKGINNGNKITETNALNIASKIFNKTRSVSDYTIEYVLNDNPKTRNINIPDTLAYIINFGNNNGFAVISSDNRIFPILAYSDTGHFKYEKSENDPVYVNFISIIDDYMATINENDTAIIIPDDYFSTCASEGPLLETKDWGDREPFNKYIEEEHPGCPVGCVAVASGQIIANCRDKFVYHDSIFNFKAIREAMDTDTTRSLINNTNDNISPITPTDTTTYSYETAVDKVARFLYFLCEDLNMKYYPGGSPAYSSDAFKLLKKLGFSVNEEYYPSYFSDDIISDLVCNGNLIYVDGRLVGDNTMGHAWVIDGCSFCWKDIYEKKEKINVLFHCNWGWGGLDNGYYSSDLFNTTYGNLEKMKYFSVRKNYKLVTPKN